MNLYAFHLCTCWRSLYAYQQIRHEPYQRIEAVRRLAPWYPVAKLIFQFLKCTNVMHPAPLIQRRHWFGPYRLAPTGPDSFV